MQKNKSCLPSWFRQERSAPEPFKAPENSSAASSRSSLDTNEIGDAPPSKHSDSENVVTSFKVEEEEVVKELTEKENEYEMEYEEEKEEEEEALKYNEEATGDATSTLKPSVRKEIEKLKEAKCKGYCHHNATCHVEVIFRDTQVAAVVPSCHCPHGWEGTRCDRHYVQAFYAPINGRYNQSSSAVPVLAFMMVMLVMFIAIVVYAYRRMSKRSDDLTYTMSNMCPPEAFTVLKTPNGRHIPAHQMISCPASNTSNPCTPHQSSAPGSRIPLRQLAVRYPGTQNNFFSILRSQGTIPSRSINDDDTPKHYKSVPRVEVSAINNSGHIDFSTISFQTEESDVSKASRTCPPPSHTVIDIDSNSKDQDFRSPSRSSGEPGTPTTCEPMISSMNL